MASIPRGSAFGVDSQQRQTSISDQIRALVRPLASLRITVTIFSLALFLILVGSLAQGRKDVWLVVGQYFRCWIAWVDVADFFPPAFFPGMLDFKWDELPVRYFPFPGGWLLGGVATINLLAAHGLRFRINARGRRLYLGLALLLVGLAVTWFVVASGMNADGFQTEPTLRYPTVWRLFQVISLGGLVWLTIASLKLTRSTLTRVGIVSAGLALGGILVVTEPLSPASMRILWQLMKAEFASLILLGACWQLFNKRAAVVLLHAGVAVLMLSEVLVGLTVSENRFSLWEGDTSNYVFDLRERELFIVEPQGDQERVVSIPEKLIAQAAAAEGENRILRDDRLPFDVEVVQFYRHSTLRRATPKDDNPATAGTGVNVIADEAKEASGMDSKSDVSTAYVTLRDKDDGTPLGTFMLSMGFEDKPESVVVDGKLYDLGLRFKRTYKPYSVTLLDVAKKDYPGTSTPRDYSSRIRLQDPASGVDREVRIWMNNPLRYRGETLYQTDYFLNEDTGRELSSLQVVNNRGWMLPYMACMIVGTGLAVQFVLTLLRFQKRRERENGLDDVAMETASRRRSSRNEKLVALALTVLVAGYLGSKFSVRSPGEGQPDLYAFGRIPTVKGGRQQPLSSVAMNRVRVLTNGKTTFHRFLRASEIRENREEILADVAAAIPGMAVGDLKDFDGGVPELVRWIAEHGGVDDEQEIWGRLTERGFSGKSAVTRKAPAIWWMLDLISGRPEARHHRVIRIDEPQLLSVLDLQPRDGATYSLAEVMEHYGELEEQIDQASRQFSADENRATRFQRRLLRLATNISRITQLRDVFSTLEFDASRPHTGLVQIMLYKDVLERMGQVSDSSLVMAVPRPGETPDGTWEPLALASIKQGMLQYAASHGITTVDALVTALIDQAPQELVLGQLQEVTSRLQAGVTDEMTLNQLAARILPTLKQEDFVLKEALTCIASSSSSDPAEIYAQLSESRRERLFNLAAADVLLKLREHVSPKARQAVNDVFQSQQVNRESVTGLLRTHTREIAEQLFSDTELAAGPGEEVDRLQAILQAWAGDDVAKFNDATVSHIEALASLPFARVDVSRSDFETWFNHAAPAYYCAALYLIAFVLASAALLAWSRPLGRAAFSITLVTFLVHTFALAGRIYISGRPPVTNLYSSAIFIGWGAVALGLIFEYINRRGIGNLVSTAAGASTLVIAYFLGKDGDTFEVLQAVLDTQFWLATHVVCITLGYSTTFLAGLFGIVYVLKGVLTPSLSSSDRRELSRMIYGTLCFAMLFSFVGTVLGGLWADDSWGRFWGWDPKENGAMMIVIWNALILHARWDGMVRERGMAVLAVAGNIVTSWSWFGVNELKAGLHTYGFTEGRLFWLLVFVFSQLIIISIGLFPRDMWRSRPGDPKSSAAA